MSHTRIIALVAAGIGAALAAVVLLFGDLAALLPSDRPAKPATSAAQRPPSGEPQLQSAPTAPETAADHEAASFDIVRVSADGASVFAGRSSPSAEVMIMANGQLITRTKANENGEWSAVTTHRFAPGPHTLTLMTRSNGPAASRAGQQITIDVAAGTRTLPPDQPPVVAPRQVLASAATSGRIVSDIAALVESAKAGETQRGVPPPMPILFKFREASFTADGQKAATLLAEYLKLRQLDRVSLSGHADERGSSQHNMELSKQRLDAVVRHLRNAGYSGRLDVQPKGDMEPFRGVDRRTIPREDAYQLDRRVELHLN